MLEAVAREAPDLIVAPMLTRAIPEAIWRRHVCLVVHPGPPGDRGPSSLDWALLEGAPRWGVTVLQAVAELDAGPVWATHAFPLREASKSAVYNHEVTEAAVRALREAVARFAAGGRGPRGGGRTAGTGPAGAPAAAHAAGRPAHRLGVAHRARAAGAVERGRQPRRARPPRRAAGRPVRGLTRRTACGAPPAPSWPPATGRSAAPPATARCGSRR